MKELPKTYWIKFPPPTRIKIPKDNMKYSTFHRTLGHLIYDCHALKLVLR